MRELGFVESVQGEYHVFISPLSSFEEEEMQNGYGWDAGISDNTLDATGIGADINGIASYVVVGWSFDSKQNTCWDDVYITINGECYYPDITERTDIVEKQGNENVLNCGFVFILPVEKVREVDSITLYGVNMETKNIGKVDISVIK